MKGIIRGKIDNLIDILRNIRKNRRSVVLRLRRQPFDDPLLTLYFVRGLPIMAHSFVVSEPWYEKLLSEEEVKSAKENIVALAHRKYGKALFRHLERYSQRVLEDVVSAIRRNDWDFTIHVEELNRESVRKLFGTGEEPTLNLKGGGVDTLSLLPELKAMGVLSVSFMDEPAEEDFLVDVHHQVVSIGLTGHYILFFPHVAVVYGALRGREFVGETEYGPNLLRLFPALKRETDNLLNLLEEYPWETVRSVGKPFALYVRYKGRGVFVGLRSTGRGVYPHKLEVMRLADALDEARRTKEEIARIVETVMRRVDDKPKSLLRVEIARYVRTYPHPEDLYRRLKLHFDL